MKNILFKVVIIFFILFEVMMLFMFSATFNNSFGVLDILINQRPLYYREGTVELLNRDSTTYLRDREIQKVTVDFIDTQRLHKGDIVPYVYTEDYSRVYTASSFRRYMAYPFIFSGLFVFGILFGVIFMLERKSNRAEIECIYQEV